MDGMETPDWLCFWLIGYVKQWPCHFEANRRWRGGGREEEIFRWEYGTRDYVKITLPKRDAPEHLTL